MTGGFRAGLAAGERARISLDLEIDWGCHTSWRLTSNFGGDDRVTGAPSACESGIGVVVDFVWHGGMGVGIRLGRSGRESMELK